MPIRAGSDPNHFQDGKPSASGANFNASHVQVLHGSTKSILCTVANSNTMNSMGAGVDYRYVMPYRLLWMVIADVVIVAGLGA